MAMLPIIKELGDMFINLLLHVTAKCIVAAVVIIGGDKLKKSSKDKLDD